MANETAKVSIGIEATNQGKGFQDAKQDLKNLESFAVASGKAIAKIEAEQEKAKQAAVQKTANMAVAAAKVRKVSLEDYIVAEQRSKQAAEETARAAQKAERDRRAAIQQSISKYNQLREAGEKIGSIGLLIGGIGAAAIGAATKFSSSYLNAIGQTEQIGKDTLLTFRSIEESGIRFGRVISEQALPYLQKAAEYADKLAKWAEEHPEIIAAALKIAGAAVVAGGSIAGAGQAIKTVGTIGSLATTAAGALGLGGGAAAAGAGGAAAAGTAGAGAIAGGAALGLGGIALGAGIYEAIARSEAGQKAGLATLNQWATVLAYGAGTLFGKQDEWAAAVGDMTGATVGATQALQDIKDSAEAAARAEQEKAAAVKNTATLENSPQKAALVQEFVNYQDALKEAEQQNEDARTAIVENAGAQRSAIEAKWADYVLSFNQQEAQAEQQHAQQRAQILRDAGREVQRIEQDSQKRLLQMRKDFDNQLHDLVGKRDALGIKQARRAYNEKRDTEIQNTNDEIARRREDLAVRLADADAQYKMERERRAQEFTLQQEKYQEELKMVEENKQKELTKLAEAYAKQIKLIEDAFIKRIAALDPLMAEAYGLWINNMQQRTAQFQQWLNNYQASATSQAGYGTNSTSGSGSINSGPNYNPYANRPASTGSGTVNSGPNYNPYAGRKFAAGGRVGYTGPALVHAGEEVISRQNVALAERMVGGSGNFQGRMLQALRDRQGNMIQLHLANGVTISDVRDMLGHYGENIVNQVATQIARMGALRG